jgi:hypothetical protein
VKRWCFNPDRVGSHSNSHPAFIIKISGYVDLAGYRISGEYQCCLFYRGKIEYYVWLLHISGLASFCELSGTDADLQLFDQ